MAKKNMKMNMGLLVDKKFVNKIATTLANPQSPFYTSIAKETKATLMKQFDRRLAMHTENKLAKQVRIVAMKDPTFLNMVVEANPTGISLVHAMWDKAYRIPIADDGARGRGDRGEMAKLGQMPPWVHSPRHGPETAIGAHAALNIVNWPDPEKDKWGNIKPYTSAPWEQYHWTTEDAFNIVEWGTRENKKDKGDPRFVTAGAYFVGIALHTGWWAKGSELKRRFIEDIVTQNARATGNKSGESIGKGLNMTSTTTRDNNNESDVKGEVDMPDGGGDITLAYVKSIGSPVFVRGVHPLNIFTDFMGRPHVEDINMLKQTLLHVGQKHFASFLNKKGGGGK